MLRNTYMVHICVAQHSFPLKASLVPKQNSVARHAEKDILYYTIIYYNILYYTIHTILYYTIRRLGRRGEGERADDGRMMGNVGC